MGEARECMNRLTDAVTRSHDLESIERCYAPDAVAQTPDQGELRGGHEIAEYMWQFGHAFPDLEYRSTQEFESGNVAIDEGHLRGTNTDTMIDPSSGQEMPATGKKIDVRECDVAVVEDGLIKEHRIYFDEVELFGQLGLLSQRPS